MNLPDNSDDSDESLFGAGETTRMSHLAARSEDTKSKLVVKLIDYFTNCVHEVQFRGQK